MMDQDACQPTPGAPCPSGENNGRREFLGAAVAAVATALTGCGKLSKEEFLQHNFRELSKEEVLTVIDRLEKVYKEKYGKDVKVANTPALPGVTGWGAVPQAPKPGVIPLRPLGVGEILDVDVIAHAAAVGRGIVGTEN